MTVTEIERETASADPSHETIECSTAVALDAPAPDGPGVHATLLVHQHRSTFHRRLVEGQPVVVGRGVDVDLAIPDSHLSRRHARFTLSGGQVWVEDLGSRNGTLLNGEGIEGAAVRQGDQVRLGSVIATVHFLETAVRGRSPIGAHRLATLLEAELARSRETGRACTLLLVRDSAGEIGARADGLTRLLRSHDVLALHSADTVAVLLPATERERALQVADRLCRPAGLQCGLALSSEAAGGAQELVDACLAALRRATATLPIQVAAGRDVSLQQPEGLQDTVRQLGSCRMPLLVVGETGTGKKTLGRAIHDQGPRRSARMVSVKCGAHAGSRQNEVLFGRDGVQDSVFERADGGTVLLEDVGELSSTAQSALLHLLETGRVARVGASGETLVDVRVIATTHQDLEALCRRELFRWDLYFQLCGAVITVPPLRSRLHELPGLAELFVRQAADSGGTVTGFDERALQLLLGYAWPGNIRELRGAVERAVAVARGERITPDDLPEAVRRAQPVLPMPRAIAAPGVADVDLRHALEHFEHQLITSALLHTEGDRLAAAQLLHIPLRTLSHKIRRLGLTRRGMASVVPSPR